jgi:hypothetical protein
MYRPQKVSNRKKKEALESVKKKKRAVREIAPPSLYIPLLIALRDNSDKDVVESANVQQNLSEIEIVTIMNCRSAERQLHVRFPFLSYFQNKLTNRSLFEPISCRRQ